MPSGDIEGLIPTTKLTGQLRDAQIASLSATKLSGKVVKAQLDPVLLSDINSAQRAISQEVQARTAALQQEARARGTAVSQLETVDRQQAQQLATLTAKSTEALSGIQEERTARSREQQANAEKITTLTAKVGMLQTTGLNLLRNSDLSAGNRFWENQDSKGVRDNKPTMQSSGSWKWQQRFAEPLPGGYYAYSVWIKPTKTAEKFNIHNGRMWLSIVLSDLVVGQWQYASVTFEAEKLVRLYLLVDGAGTEIQYPMLVSGNIPAVWSGNLLDMTPEIDTSVLVSQADFNAYKSAETTKAQANATQLATLTTQFNQQRGEVNELKTSKASKSEVATLARTALSSVWQNDINTVNTRTLARIDTLQTTVTNATQSLATLETQLTASFTVHDTRNDNRPPSWYWQHHPKTTVNEFKSARVIGLTASGFCSLSTVVAWNDPSGNPISQQAIDSTGAVYRRKSDVAYTGSGRSPTYTRDQWTAWVADETALGSQAKADAVKAIAQAAQQAVQTAQADIANERTARANADEALTRQATSLTSRLQQVEATVSQQSQTVTRLDGTVQAIHTIRTETIKGGRKAVAGLSLGSNGGTESSLILMADRTQFVKNSQDGSPKALLTIANNQMVLNGELIATGGITARHLATDSVSTGTLQAGAVRGHHVAAGELTADKLAIGLGGNLLYNPIFANDANGWAHSTYSARLVRRTVSQSHSGVSKQRYLLNENLAFLEIDTSSSSIANGARVGYLGQFDIPVIAGKTYLFSAYVSAHRCKARLLVSGRNATNGYPFSVYSQYSTGSFKDSIENASRIFCKFTVPQGQDINRVELFMLAEKEGAYNNATLFMMRPMLEECTEHTREPSPWQNAGVTLIHGGSIITQTVTAQQLAAGSVTTEKLVAGAVNAGHIAANTVGAQHVQARSLSAEKLNIQSLSSVSANLGTITAGSININNRFKVNTSGQVEMRSAANNVGMVMNNDQIIVYDTQGRIRVKIGRL